MDTKEYATIFHYDTVELENGLWKKKDEWFNQTASSDLSQNDNSLFQTYRSCVNTFCLQNMHVNGSFSSFNLYFVLTIVLCKQYNLGQRKIDNWGADIHTFVFTDYSNNWFQKKF